MRAKKSDAERVFTIVRRFYLRHNAWPALRRITAHLSWTQDRAAMAIIDSERCALRLVGDPSGNRGTAYQVYSKVPIMAEPALCEVRVVPFNNLYEVSSDGRVRRIGNADWLQPIKWKGRVLRVSLSAGGVERIMAIHRIVAFAFLGPPPGPEYEVAHNDGNSLNNHKDNIRWATHAENMKDMALHGTIPLGSKNGHAKITETDVPAIRQLKADGLSSDEVGALYGVTRSVVNSIIRGDTWRHV